MKIVLGLGNPGIRYRETRHNLGFRVADLLARRREATLRQAEDLGNTAWTAPIELGGREVILAKPRTFMNRSGRAARALCQHYGLSPGDLLVVHDDADLELGRVRIRPRGSAGGHRGVQSIMDGLATEAFPRVRLGVRGEGRDQGELDDYVLEAFDEEEREISDALVGLGADAVEAVLERGLVEAMNLFNARSVPAQNREKGS